MVQRGVLDRSRLLRRAVHELAHEDAGLGDLEPGLRFEILRQPEVDELHLIPPAAVAGDHHVVGRDVAVDDARGVDRLEPAQGLDAEVDRERQGEDAVRLQPVMDVFTLDVLRHHVEAAVGQAREVVEDGDVRVLDLGGDARFLGEALQGVRIGGAIGAQDLDDPQLLQVDVARPPDLAHAARGKAVEDLVLAVEDRPAIAFGHRGSQLLGRSVRWILSYSSPNFSPGFVTRRRRCRWLQGVATEASGGGPQGPSSTPTERNAAGAGRCVAAVEVW